MKRASLILNIVLVIAVAVLYYLHFAPAKSVADEGTATDGKGNILYINTDSVITSYNFTKEKSEFLKKNNEERQKMLEGKQAAYESAVRKYQSSLSILTDRERAAQEEKIAGMQNEFMMLQQQFQQDAMVEQETMLSSIVDTLESFMNDYVKGKNVEYVLGYQANGTMFYKNKQNDITNDVIEKLNARYKSVNATSEEEKKEK